VGEYNVAMELLVFWWKNTVTNKHHKMAAHEYYKGFSTAEYKCCQLVSRWKM